MAGRNRDYPLDRRAVVAALLKDRGDLLLVTGLGGVVWDATAAGDSPLTFPLWGAMGQAGMIGLGLALAQPDRRVLVITGDGEQLMGLGSLATIAVARAPNLAIAVIDNEIFGETGMQPTHTASGADLAAIAAGAGLRVAGTAVDEGALETLIPKLRHDEGPIFGVIKVRAEALDFVMPPRDGAHLKDRFREALLGPARAYA